jgi:hypothetical protein
MLSVALPVDIGFWSAFNSSVSLTETLWASCLRSDGALSRCSCH